MLLPRAFFPSSGIRGWFVYTLEIQSAEINQRDVKIAAVTSDGGGAERASAVGTATRSVGE